MWPREFRDRQSDDPEGVEQSETTPWLDGLAYLITDHLASLQLRQNTLDQRGTKTIY